MCPADNATAGSWAGVGPGWSTEIWICCGIGGTCSISQIEAWSSSIYAWYQEFEFNFCFNFCFNFFLNFKHKWQKLKKKLKKKNLIL
jgi:hypothetical protein